MTSEKMHMSWNGVLVAGLAVMTLIAPLPGLAQQAFPTAEVAADAFVDAVASNDEEALRRILGSTWRSYFPKGGIGNSDVANFLANWAESHKIVTESAGKARLAVGSEEWLLPIPIVEKKGAWRFDLHAGADEIKTRRIGRNELAAMQAALAYYDAQKEYARVDHNGDGVLEYAQKLISTPGKQDGLYWAALEGEDESPLGPLFGDGEPSGRGYYGYHYRILTAQGDHAPGGAYDYRIKNRLSGGFALVAWPVKYGDSGVMSFIVSHDGVLYEKDLGPKSSAAARAMKQFNPDSSWQKVNP